MLVLFPNSTPPFMAPGFPSHLNDYAYLLFSIFSFTFLQSNTCFFIWVFQFLPTDIHYCLFLGTSLHTHKPTLYILLLFLWIIQKRTIIVVLEMKMEGGLVEHRREIVRGINGKVIKKKKEIKRRLCSSSSSSSSNTLRMEREVPSVTLQQLYNCCKYVFKGRGIVPPPQDVRNLCNIMGNFLFSLLLLVVVGYYSLQHLRGWFKHKQRKGKKGILVGYVVKVMSF